MRFRVPLLPVYLRSFLPKEKRCFICTAIHHSANTSGNLPFCDRCIAKLPARERGYCPLCGEPSPWADLPPCLCGRCLASPPTWDNFLFHGLYEGQLRDMLLALKFKGSVETGNCLGLLLAQHPSISTLTVDCIVPIPLHKERLALRGFNQSLEIARPLAARLAVPLLPRLMVRKKATAPQSGCNLNTRRENIRNAFQSSSEVAGKRILLVDDTVTTGSTIEAAARSLREAGAKTISVAVISRTARHFLKR